MDIECAMFEDWPESPVSVQTSHPCHANRNASKSVRNTSASSSPATSTSSTLCIDMPSIRNRTPKRSKTTSQESARRTDNSIQQDVNDSWSCRVPTLDRRRWPQQRCHNTEQSRRLASDRQLRSVPCKCHASSESRFRLNWLLLLAVNCVLLLSAVNGTAAAGLAAEAEHSGGHYTHTWAVHIPGGDAVADQIAAEQGFVNQGKVSTRF